MTAKFHVLRSPRSASALLLGALLALSGCKSSGPSTTAVPPPPEKSRVEISNEFTATADVVAVERAQRLVTLRRESGDLIVLQVGEAARNFDQIAVGDRVRVRYREALAASLRPAGESAREAEGALGAGRTAAGAKPGAGIGVALAVRVRIESIDPAHDIVVFSLASGELIAHRVATSEGREFVRGLQVGNIVQLEYSEAMALTVEEL